MATTQTYENIQSFLTAFDLDYEVKMSPIYFGVEGKEDYSEFPNVFATYRGDTGQPFGVVRTKYRVIQNKEVFSFLDDLTDFTPHRGGHLAAGCWVMGNYPQTEILGDIFTPHIYFVNTHDGSKKFTVAFNPIREKGRNNLNVLAGDWNFATKHTAYSGYRIEDARKFAGKYSEAIDRLRDIITQAYNIRLTDDERADIYKKAMLSDGRLPESKTLQMDISTLKTGEFSSANIGHRGNGYGLLLTMTDFIRDVIQPRQKNKDLFYWKHVFQVSPYIRTALNELGIK